MDCTCRAARPSGSLVPPVSADPRKPRPHRAVLGLRITGGFLAGIELEFADGLNCLIGGRGTGKTTALEFLPRQTAVFGCRQILRMPSGIKVPTFRRSMYISSQTQFARWSASWVLPVIHWTAG